jgi:hypothetical protein
MAGLARTSIHFMFLPELDIATSASPPGEPHPLRSRARKALLRSCASAGNRSDLEIHCSSALVRQLQLNRKSGREVLQSVIAEYSLVK